METNSIYIPAPFRLPELTVHRNGKKSQKQHQKRGTNNSVNGTYIYARVLWSCWALLSNLKITA